MEIEGHQATESTPEAGDGDGATAAAPGDGAPVAREESRRDIICDSARKLVWLAPVVLLFRPNAAVAKSHTGWTHP
jgi:hypothetical protein